MTRINPIWGNLAGPPVRRSPAVTTDRGTIYQGWVKVRLCHARGRSYLLPDILVGFGGRKYFLPSYFGAPSLDFHRPDGSVPGRRFHEATLSMDVTAPRGRVATRLEVKFRSGDHILSYEDGAQLYRCTYSGPAGVGIGSLVSGNCTRLPDGDFAIDLFHHTVGPTVDKILASGELWSGPFNLAGTAKLEDVAHAYFTTLPSIVDEDDLRRIAMSSAGRIPYQTTSDRPREETLDLPVYQGVTANRTASMTFEVPCRIVAPAHLLFHPNVHPNPAYYEVVGSEIVRVAVRPGVALKFIGRAVSAAVADLRRFDNVVEGDASDAAGLEAPMREDTTGQVAFLEPLDQGLDLFTFWLKNQNIDLVSGRTFERRRLSGVP